MGELGEDVAVGAVDGEEVSMVGHVSELGRRVRAEFSGRVGRSATVRMRPSLFQSRPMST